MNDQETDHVAQRKAAGVGKLLLGHYSARYNDETVLLKEAKEFFEESYLTNEGMVISV